MIDIFFALSTVYIGHRIFTVLDPETDSFIHFFVELTFVFWVLAGLFTHLWYMFLIIIITGQAAVIFEYRLQPKYYKKLYRISALLDILLLGIITLITLK